MIIGGGVGNGKRMEHNKDTRAHCNWIHFYCRRNDFGAYNHHRPATAACYKRNWTITWKIACGGGGDGGGNSLTPSPLPCDSIASSHSAVSCMRVRALIIAHTTVLISFRLLCIVILIYCRRNRNHREPASSPCSTLSYHIYFLLVVVVFLSDSSRHSHFIFRFFLHIITISISVRNM